MLCKAIPAPLPLWPTQLWADTAAVELPGLSAPSRAAHEEQCGRSRWGADRGQLWYRNLLLSSGGRELSQRDDNQGHEHRCTQEGGDDNGTDSSGPQRACRDRNHSGVRLGRSLGGRAVGFIPFALHILAPGTPSCHPPAVPVPVSPTAAAWPHAVGSRLAPSQASCQGHRQPAPTGCLALCFPATSTPRARLLHSSRLLHSGASGVAHTLFPRAEFQARSCLASGACSSAKCRPGAGGGRGGSSGAGSREMAPSRQRG